MKGFLGRSLTSWRTTLAGICTAVIAIADGIMKLVDADPMTKPDWALIIAAVTAAIGLIFARDVAVTSKQLGLPE